MSHSLERGMQGPVDGRISPNCKRGYMDPRAAESDQILNREQRTAFFDVESFKISFH